MGCDALVGGIGQALPRTLTAFASKVNTGVCDVRALRLRGGAPPRLSGAYPLPWFARAYALDLMFRHRVSRCVIDTGCTLKMFLSMANPDSHNLERVGHQVWECPLCSKRAHINEAVAKRQSERELLTLGGILMFHLRGDQHRKNMYTLLHESHQTIEFPIGSGTYFFNLLSGAQGMSPQDAQTDRPGFGMNGQTSLPAYNMMANTSSPAHSLLWTPSMMRNGIQAAQTHQPLGLMPQAVSYPSN